MTYEAQKEQFTPASDSGCRGGSTECSRSIQLANYGCEGVVIRQENSGILEFQTLQK